MIKVRRIESIEDILTTHEGTPFTVTYVSGTGFKVEPVEPKIGLDVVRGQVPQPGTKPPKMKHATHTPAVGKGLNIAIREGPLNDLLKLERVDIATAKPVIREWYPLVTRYTYENYTGQYVRWMHKQGLLDEYGKPVASSVRSNDGIHVEDVAPEPREEAEGDKKATYTPIIGRTKTIAIRRGPMDDIMKLEKVHVRTVYPILRMWYPHVVEGTVEDYTWIYLRFLRAKNYIDDEGHVLKKLATKEEGKPVEGVIVPSDRGRLVALMASHPEELLDCFTDKFEHSTDIFDRFAEKVNIGPEGAGPTIRGMAIAKSLKVASIDGTLLEELVESMLSGKIIKYRKKGTIVSLKPSEIEKKPSASVSIEEPAEVDDEGPDLFHPVRDDLTVLTIKGKVEIYLEPLNEILKLERIDDMRLHKILVKYYDVPRVSFMITIKGVWMEFLKDEGYIDNVGKPTCKEVAL